jgi:CheY-like chemotaxis protein
MMPSPVPIFYLDDDTEALRQFAECVRPNVINPVRLFTSADKLFAAVKGVDGPCAVLVDLVMPEEAGGGYAVIAKLKEMPSFSGHHSIAIAVTATMPDDVLLDRATDCGAHVFIHKPVEFPDLVLAIGRPGWFRVQFSSGAAVAVPQASQAGH